MMRALHIAFKDVRVWTRDIAALGVLLGMPIVLILILGSALGGAGNSSRVPVAIVNLDSARGTDAQGAPDYAHEIVEVFRKSERLSEVFDTDYSEKDEEAYKRRVANGELTAVAVVPPGFSESIAQGKPVRIRVYTDPGAGTSAGIFESVLQSVVGHYSAASVAVQTVIGAAATHSPQVVSGATAAVEIPELQAAAIAAVEDDPPVVVEDAEADVSEQLTALSYYAVSMTAMFLMFGAMFGAFSTIEERREQTLSRLLSTPTSSVSVTGGKMLGVFALGMLQFVVLYFATSVLFDVEWGDDVLAIFLIAAAEMLAVTGLAVLIAAVAKTERGAAGIGPLVVQVQALLGGAFFAITILPEWLQPIRYASVIGWTLEGWQTVQIRGGGVSDVMGPVVALLGFALAFFGISAALTGARR